MAGAKEIRGKIKSIKNTQKITKAMEMVAASKMRKAQDRMASARPYADRIQHVIGHLAQANPDFQHPLLVAREQIRRVGYLVVSTDRGLCGGLNNNMFKLALGHMKQHKDAGAEIDLSLIGAKALTFFRRFGARIVSQVSHLGDTPHVTDLIGSVKLLLDAYESGELDAVYLVHNEFVSTMSQQPVVRQMLPVEPMDQEALQSHWDYIYEPSAAGRAAQPLRGEPGLPRGTGQHRLRAGGAHGGDEGRHRQRRRADRQPAVDLQQGPPGGDHTGTFGNRGRCGGRLGARASQLSKHRGQRHELGKNGSDHRRSRGRGVSARRDTESV